ncbi:hypothetical protein Tco_1270563 [Tanacetum coccineum]
MPSWKLVNPSYVYQWIPNPAPETPAIDGTNRGYQTRQDRIKESYAIILEEINKKVDAEAKAVQIILTGIDNDIYSIVDACPNAIEIWKAIEERQRFVTIVKQNQDLKNVSYHKLYEILKQHQNEVNEIRDERLARTDNLLALVAQQQRVYQPQHNPTYYSQSSSTRSQSATRNKGKAIANSPPPIYDPGRKVVDDDEASSKKKEIDKLMALISMYFKKIYKPTNNILITSSNTKYMNVDNTPRTKIGTGYN